MLELALRLAVSLGVVLGLFWLVARTGARKMAGTRGLLRVHGRQSLSRTASVAVVEVGSRVLVVGVSEGGVRLLTELDLEEVAEPENRVVDDGLAATSVAVPAARAGVPAALGGSLLSTQTWKQAWAAATSKAVPARGLEGSARE